MPPPLPESTTLRLVWSIIETMPASDLLALEERTLVRKLMQAVTCRIQLSRVEQVRVQNYLVAKVPLIRTFAATRSSP